MLVYEYEYQFWIEIPVYNTAVQRLIKAYQIVEGDALLSTSHVPEEAIVCD